jgi:hypothetical protein
MGRAKKGNKLKKIGVNRESENYHSSEGREDSEKGETCSWIEVYISCCSCTVVFVSKAQISGICSFPRRNGTYSAVLCEGKVHYFSHTVLVFVIERSFQAETYIMCLKIHLQR